MGSELSRTNVRFIVWDMPKVSDAHRAARYEQILDAAIRCVGREGFHRTTMAHVIAESGLSAGAVYGYFKGKEDLIKAIAGRALGGFAELLHEIAIGPGPVTPATAMRAMVHEVERLGGGLRRRLPQGGHARLVGGRAQPGDPRASSAPTSTRCRPPGSRCSSGPTPTATSGARATAAAMARVLIGLMPGFVLQGLLLGKVDATTYADGFESLTVPLMWLSCQSTSHSSGARSPRPGRTPCPRRTCASS